MKEMREPESRAPQFAAYESLRGYGELIEECKFVPDERVELSEEEIEKLSLLLSSLRKGMTVTVTYYAKNLYTALTATVREVDTVFQTLTVGKTKIPFRDILKIKKGET